MTARAGRQEGRIIALLALGLAAAWAVLALLTWGDAQNGVRVSSPFSTYGYGQAALFSVDVPALNVVATLVWNGLAMLVGYAFVIRPIWGGKHLARAPWMAFAGVVPGALMIAALTRLVTLAAPNAVAAPMIAAIVALAGAFAAIEIWRSERGARVTGSPWLLWGVAALALLVSLVFQIHMDRGHAVAEGSIWFINEVFLSPLYGVGADGQFPLFTQHYDEAAFLHPLIYLTVAPGADASPTLTLIYWMTLAISRLGMIALTYVALRGLSLDRLSALICTAFVCMASLSINPFSSRLLFDSLSPMAYTLHMARFLAPVLPLLIVSAATQGAPRLDVRSIIAALLLGLGFAATPIHLAMLAPWAFALLVLAAVTKPPLEQLWRAAAAATAIVLAAVSIVYLAQAAPGPVRAGLLAASAGAGGLWMLWALWRQGLTLPHFASDEARRIGVLVVLLCGYGVGLIFLGNVAFIKIAPILADVWPWSELDVVQRLASHIVSPSVSLAASPFCETGYEWGYRTITGHCGAFPMFARTYGLPFIVIGAVLGWRVLNPEIGASARAARLDSLMLWSLALCLLALPGAFLIFDFITPSGDDWSHGWSIWLRSRLIEPWFVGGVLIALAFFLREASARGRTLTQIALVAATAIHLANPLVAPAQWVANVAYWVDAVVR